MPRFYFRKLVRDRVVNNCLEDPKVLHTEYRALEGSEYIQELIYKIQEEAAEIDAGDRHDALKELADLQAVIDSIREELGFTEVELNEAKVDKMQQKGAFTKRHYIEYLDLADDSEWIEYFRKDSEKYPES